MENFKFNTIFVISLLLATLAVAQTDVAREAELANEYYVNGEFEKAADIYKKLDNKRAAIPLIHSNYLDLLIRRAEFKKAEKYLDFVMKQYPGELTYPADLIMLQDKMDPQGKEKKIVEVLGMYGRSHYQLKILAENLVNRNLLPEALRFYKEARQVSGNPFAFALDLAAIYRMQDDKSKMTEEYLAYATINQRNVRYIKNIFQQLLSDPEDLDFLEETLIKKVQQQPDNTMFMELLIWVEIQRRNYYGAFIQARALDKRMGNPGTEVLQIGRIALDNQAWLDAMEIFDYISEEYGKSSPYYTSSRQKYIEAKEGDILSTYPVDKSQIRLLTNEYQQLYEEFGPTPTTLEGLRNKARLLAFYLDDKKAAIVSLQEIVGTKRISGEIRDRAKLDLGDIYLLLDEPWEATLLYSQVEKSNKYGQLSYEAKLKNAKLNYFVGNFALAKSHLDILKNATTKEIANDALDLSVLIKNNTILDTTDEVMKRYAKIDLLIYQKKIDQSIEQLLDLRKTIPGHSLEDEILWLVAKLHLEKGRYNESLTYLDELLQKFGFDILADDASFQKAEIVQKYLDDDDQASNLYRDFITQFPGSMYAAEARKRYRELRGDELN